MEYSYQDKLTFLKNTRASIKNKKTGHVFDDSKDKFGFDKMKLLTSVKNTSEVKGYPFELYRNSEYEKSNFKYALKVVPTEVKFDKKCNPSTLEIQLLKNLTKDLVDDGISPNIVYYLTNIKSVNRCEALKCIDLKRLEAEDKIRRNGYILVSEFINGSNLRDWVYSRCDDENKLSNIEWQCLVFQILYTLFVLQDKYKLMHNDMHYGNILMDTSIKAQGYFVYTLVNSDGIETIYYIKNYGVIPKLWDFEYSMMYSDKIPGLFPNQLVIGDMKYNKKQHKTVEVYSTESAKYKYNMPVQYNEIYDSHYFLCSLLDLVITRPLFDWIQQVFPKEVIPDDSTSYYSDSDSDSDSYSDSDSDSDSDSRSDKDSSVDEQVNLMKKLLNLETQSLVYSESYSDSYGSTNNSSVLVDSGRLVNYRSDHLKIPTTAELLGHAFFDILKQKPDDFIESECVFFKYIQQRH